MIAPPGGAAAMYYTGPSEDFSRPGRTWYPTLGQDPLPALGRGVDLLPRGRPRPSPADRAGALPRRHAQPLPAHARGYVGPRARAGRSTPSGSWASSATSTTPRTSSACCAAQAMRAVRVVVDIGMHLELRDPRRRAVPPRRDVDARARAAVRDRARRSSRPTSWRSEVDRYLGLPGQAIRTRSASGCGSRHATRRAQRGGAAFDLKEFHRAALDLGPDGSRAARPRARPPLTCSVAHVRSPRPRSF